MNPLKALTDKLGPAVAFLFVDGNGYQRAAGTFNGGWLVVGGGVIVRYETLAHLLRDEEVNLGTVQTPSDRTPCEWEITEGTYTGLTWASDCGTALGFDAQFGGGPEDHGFKFCPYCGKPLIESDQLVPEGETP
jgi:hypothetical protein